RVLVSQGRVVAAMMRHSAPWVTNVRRGGKPVAAVADGIMRDLAIAAAAAVGVNFAGVDVLYGRHERPTVREVNSMPSWSGWQRTTPIDIAQTLASDLISGVALRAQGSV